ncbi:sigma-70 family RNA polymerase sigma factor [Paenibacillus sp. KQZ6P-2]|uniref:Sigma-70 family RNA polymerase sigma factor n=1 Tax=Paenibacillus mangrovi TaxID=2931978 RepID=A0A9X1WMJ4_9BACL|nr:sigma-70 family RNA polymerase sigma factor [Paenibacillus mangrovi]MCJ8011649.1 sigma-70 family RNA polymerase sigma factor [Paenibacillus mangrovi]
MESIGGVMISDDPYDALQDLMRDYSQDVWNFAFLITRNKEAADDISQEVFLKAFKHWRRFEGRSSPKTWLLAITRNLARNWLRSHAVRKIVLLDRIEDRGGASSAESEYLDRLQTESIWSHVLRLPAKYREVLVLEAHYELEYSDIASLLGIAEGTVKSRIHRARKRMEKAMKGDLGHEEH